MEIRYSSMTYRIDLHLPHAGLRVLLPLVAVLIARAPAPAQDSVGRGTEPIVGSIDPSKLTRVLTTCATATTSMFW